LDQASFLFRDIIFTMSRELLHLVKDGERIDPSAPTVKNKPWSRWGQKELGREHAERYSFAASQGKNHGENHKQLTLDCACGTGYGSRILEENGNSKKVISLDRDQRACLYTKKNNNRRVVQADASHLPFKDDAFGEVISFETIEHLPEPKKFAKEASRVLKENGKITISTPNREVIASTSYRDPQKTFNPFHLHELSLEEMLGLLADKFTDINIFGQRILPKPVSWIHRKIMLPAMQKLSLAPEGWLRRLSRFIIIVTTSPKARKINNNQQAEYIIIQARKSS